MARCGVHKSGALLLEPREGEFLNENLERIESSGPGRPPPLRTGPRGTPIQPAIPDVARDTAMPDALRGPDAGHAKGELEANGEAPDFDDGCNDAFGDLDPAWDDFQGLPQPSVAAREGADDPAGCPRV